MRELTGIWKRISIAICIPWGIWFVYTALFHGPHTWFNIALSLALALVLVFMLFPANKRSSPKNKPSYLDMVLMIASLVPCVYVMFHYQEYLVGLSGFSTIDVVFSIVLLLLLIEGSRRCTGWVAPILAILMLVYSLFLGEILPGRWWFGAIDARFLLGGQLFHTEMGYWGMLPRIAVITVAMFIFFGPVLFATGTGDTFMKIARFIGGKISGGAAQTAVVASAFFGTISGSATANVATTGVFTIPIMKRTGYKPEFAAAVEVAASTGGQIMPPIMGAGAFIMAEFLGIPYLAVVVAAVLPAILYYFGIAFGVHFEASRLHLGRLPQEFMPRLKEVLNFRALISIVGPLGVLLGLLVIGYTPQFCAAWALIVTIVIYLLPSGRLSWGGVKAKFTAIGKALVAGGQTFAWLLVLITVLQVMVSLITFTGMAVQFSDVVFTVGKNNLFVSLVLAGIVVMILGVGMPTTPAYLIGVVVFATGLARLGVLPLTAHLFIFYYALLSCMTPPVCIAAFPAAAIAGTGWMRVGLLAVRLGIGAYIVPFAFLYNPSLIMKGEPISILVTVVAAIAAIMCISAAGMGYFLKPLSIFERIVLAAASICLLTPNPWLYVLGFVLLLASVVSQKFMPPIPILGARR